MHIDLGEAVVLLLFLGGFITFIVFAIINSRKNGK
jgi:hypothetical protein